jgi:hypothetical protein
VLESIRQSGTALKGPITTPVGGGFRSVNVGLRTALDHYAQRVGWSHGRMDHIRWNEKGLSLPHQVIDDAIAFADAHLDVALELVKIFFRIDLVKIVPRIGAGDHHDEEIAPIVEIAVAHRRLEEMPVLFDPIVQIDRRLDFGGGVSA